MLFFAKIGPNSERSGRNFFTTIVHRHPHMAALSIRKYPDIRRAECLAAVMRLASPIKSFALLPKQICIWEMDN